MPMYTPHTPVWDHLERKSVLLRFPPGTDFFPTKDNTQATIDVVIYEPGLGIRICARVIRVLQHCAGVVRVDCHVTTSIPPDGQI